MDPENIETPIVEDESELDKAIEDSVNSVRAGNKMEETPATPKEEDTTIKKEDAPAPKEEDPSEPLNTDKKKDEGYEFRIPNKGKFESDESFELRIQLLDQVKRRKAATTPEAKEALSNEISTTKGQLKTLNSVDKTINNLNKVADEIKPDEDPAIVADRERLKELGGATKDDVIEMVRQERLALETKSTLDKFIERTPEMKDADVREVFFDFVDANYNWQDKTGKELMTVLELAKENMFKPSETIQERVIIGADVQQKINAMDFSGSTGAKVELSADMRQSIDELKATCMSEEKALELLQD